MGALPANLSIGTISGFWLFSAWPSFPWASLKLKQRQLPIQRLTLIFFMEATTDLDIIITVATLTTATTARDLLRLSQHLPLTPRLTLTPTTATMARGLLMQRLPLLLKLTPRLTPIFSMEAITDLDIITMVATLTTATTARDLLRLSLLLLLLLMPRLIPGMGTTVDFHTTATATHTMDMAMAMVTTGASKKGSNQELTRMKCQHF